MTDMQTLLAGMVRGLEWEPFGVGFKAWDGVSEGVFFADDEVACKKADELRTARILAALNPDAVLALVAAAYADAAGTIDKHKTDYIENHGAYDPSTGVTEFPGNGDEWVGEWEENADAIRTRTPTDATAALERMLADARVEGLEMAAKRITGAQALPIDVGGSVVLDTATVDACATALRAMKGEGK